MYSFETCCVYVDHSCVRVAVSHLLITISSNLHELSTLIQSSIPRSFMKRIPHKSSRKCLVGVLSTNIRLTRSHYRKHPVVPISSAIMRAPRARVTMSCPLHYHSQGPKRNCLCKATRCGQRKIFQNRKIGAMISTLRNVLKKAGSLLAFTGKSAFLSIMYVPFIWAVLFQSVSEVNKKKKNNKKIFICPM
jgi:hypothetical protein